ncbi:MAG: sigma-70 family RNA polymerase sigma factor [Cyclobacteriaceae bacterium]
MTEEAKQEIFHNWLDKYRALFFKVIRIYAFNDYDRTDLFQEISLQVWRSIPSFRAESSESTWLYRIALNTSIKWIKTEKKHNSNHQQLDDKVAGALKANPVQTDEKLSWLYDQIGKMNEIEKSLCLLLFEGFSYKKMAELLGISESNVAVKIHRIKKTLMSESQKFEDHGV